MIPLRLEIENFLSYRSPVLLKLEGIHLACIAGDNGAGKSSLLDAITWALFGKCRAPGRDDVVNHRAVTAGEAARVQLDFELEKVAYRVLRVQAAGKTGLLELQVSAGDGRWKPLTEATKSGTQEQLEALLRMSYETFTNASFLLQGRADEFTVKRPGDRKRILGELLGVSHWELYRDQAAARRREAERELAALDGRLKEIAAELAQEPARRERLEVARSAHAATRRQRETQAQLVQSAQVYEAAVGQQRTLLVSLSNSLTQTRATIGRLEQTRAQRQGERDLLQQTLDQAADIEAAHAAWQAAAAELAALDELAQQWNRHNTARQQALLVVERERTRLAQMVSELERRRQEAAARQRQQAGQRDQLAAIQTQLAPLREQLAARDALQARLGELQTALGALRGEQPRLKDEMEKLKQRQIQLQAEEGGRCPFCDQELTLDHCAALIADIQQEGETLAGRYRANASQLEECQREQAELSQQLKTLAQVERELRAAERQETGLQTQLAEAERALADWEQQGAPRLSALQEQLAADAVAPDAQVELARAEQELAALAYDPDQHTSQRARATALAAAQQDYQRLVQARAALAPLAASLHDLAQQLDQQQQQAAGIEEQQRQTAAALESLGPAPVTDLLAAERELNLLREAEVQASKAVGAAEQALQALDDLRRQRTEVESDRRQTGRLISALKTLERAFGRNGVQALLIEQALPAIQDSANELLDRLTGGEMRVNFSTQRELKSRDALAETLDIHISDSAGQRPYEMYSGGEAFRVNFAIRIALSRLLAQRAGARLQTLVIDEGFGSQDPEGRQRLIEAINTIQADFSRVLVITHIEELKDAFPVRILVTKDAGGSQLSIS